MDTAPVLIDGKWRPATTTATFQSENPAKKALLPTHWPQSAWEDCDAALSAAERAHEVLRSASPESLARFLEKFAQRIEARAAELCEIANIESGLPVKPRLADVELPRTVGQLRQAAAAAREGSWALPTIDTKAGIASTLASIGPVCVFGPNNFPLAFNSVAGGDFAAAIAAGNPVIAKANTSHPGTTRALAEEAFAALEDSELPKATVQLLYRTSHADGARLVADPRNGATGYTGSRSAGLTLKAAADAAGKPIYLELSSVNPVLMLPGVLEERCDALVDEFVGSCLMGAGQFCTNPGLVIVIDSVPAQKFIGQVAARFGDAAPGVLLSQGVERSLVESIGKLKQAGAEILVGGSRAGGDSYRCSNTLLRVSGKQFVEHAEALQTEAFGNASLVVVAADLSQAAEVLEKLEGNLTGTIYSSSQGADDAAYTRLEPLLRARVGRLLNDKMPTGVAVSPAMNHGGPYPATGHPGFTAVGIPASLRRFAMLQCYDNVRPARLPAALGARNPNGRMFRLIDGVWTQDDVATQPAAGAAAK